MYKRQYVQCPDCGGWFEEGNEYRNQDVYKRQVMRYNDPQAAGYVQGTMECSWVTPWLDQMCIRDRGRPAQIPGSGDPLAVF